MLTQYNKIGHKSQNSEKVKKSNNYNYFENLEIGTLNKLFHTREKTNYNLFERNKERPLSRLFAEKKNKSQLNSPNDNLIKNFFNMVNVVDRYGGNKEKDELNLREGDIEKNNALYLNDDDEGYINRKYKFKNGSPKLSDDISTAFIDFINNGMFNSYYLLLNDVDKTPVTDSLNLFTEHLLRLLDNDKKYIVIIDKPGKPTKYQTLSKDRIIKIRNQYYKPASEGVSGRSGSDLDWFGTGEEYKNYDFYHVQELDKVKKNNGSYFAYSHNTIFDLKDLQIISVDDDAETHRKVNKEHCFINSVRKFYGDKIEKKVEDVLHKIKNLIGTNQFKTSNLRDVLPDWLTITVQKYEDDGKKGRLYTFETSNAKKNKSLVTHNVKLFLVREHYMPQIKIMGNTAAIVDPSKFKEHMSTLASTLVLGLIKNNKLVPCKFNYKVGEIIDDIDLSNIDNEQKLFIPKKTNKKDFIYIFADYESIVYDTDIHLPVMLGWCDEDSSKVYRAKSQKDLKDNNMITWMFDDLIKKYDMTKLLEKNQEDKKNKMKEFCIYFHNLKYDFHLILKNIYITLTGELERSGSQYSAQVTYKGIKFNFIDSFKLIPSALASFKSVFDLKSGKKDFDLYNIVDKNNYDKPCIPLDEFKIMLKEREGRDYKNEDFAEYVINNEYYHMRHYEDYLIADCETLRDGLYVLRDCINKITGLDAFLFLTMPSLSNMYLTKKKCFDGTYSITGNLQQYVMKNVVGGRTCLQNNEKIIVEDEIEDFDAVSQYPSSMSIVKLPKGKAELIQNLDIESILDLYQQFVITCKVKINKFQQIPMISQKNKNGVRQWVNNVEGFIEIDLYTYNDLVKYHHAEISEITRGVGWRKSNGYNDNINAVMKHLFKSRAEAKKAGNEGLSNCYKLLMNSAYGYTLVSASEYDIKYLRGISKFQSYVNNNYHRIKTITRLDNEGNDESWRYRAKVYKSTMGNYNLAHLGMTILSKSKSMMNEVFGLANDNNIPILYTDTDSVHMLKKDVEPLAELYRKTYGRELIGKDLQQFHTDFESKKISGKVWSKKFIGLGKKCYLDILTNDKGEIDHHIRFKGANSKNIIAYCKENNMSIEKFYQKLYDGEQVNIDICKGSVRFSFGDTSVSTKETMVKKFSFTNNPIKLSIEY